MPVESAGVEGFYISKADLVRFVECFRQYRLGYEVGKSNTAIINRPSP